ncbi:hypothetical protein N7492_009914 [Penicillium capsulatum]|uniref:BTB domain-containing protein n=1 Tax=Penicillium capsulatum TaxID=69766 RepID=A0A9W9HQ44_9EURO|nr:hypothetical protein N7492_009914 [Penicillium capsulatum]KAJ6112425.1 hypothetical protein N7512_007749 [Penicillium capsulatum]
MPPSIPDIKELAENKPWKQTKNNSSSFLRSTPFLFIVGENETRVTIHAEVLHRLSAPLAAMVDNGMMREALEGHVVLSDVEEDVFLAFSEFAYQGFYNTPSHPEPENKIQANILAAKKGWYSTNPRLITNFISSVELKSCNANQPRAIHNLCPEPQAVFHGEGNDEAQAGPWAKEGNFTSEVCGTLWKAFKCITLPGSRPVVSCQSLGRAL